MDVYYSNDYFILFIEGNKVSISVIKEGFDIGRFNTEVLAAFPRLKITKFALLSSAITNTVKGPVLIGERVGICETIVSSDGLSVLMKLNLTKSEFDSTDIDKLNNEIRMELGRIKVDYGILELTKNDMSINENFEVARGKAPISGNDAIVKMYEISEIKPSLEKAGEVDHYELNVINKILKQEWLGERFEPTKGTPGISVFGTEIKAPDGKQTPLKYDANTVSKQLSEDSLKTFLAAKRNGAVVYKGELISVLNSIEVDGNVGYGTGNIDFNGFVDIAKSVEDNFSVIADENIQIKGEMGVGAVDRIESRNGDVYIKGGIAGRFKAVIKAKGNIYTKFASDCTIIADGTVNIGFYAMNCKIKAKEIIFESLNSRLIGGEAEADIKIKVGEVGSKSATKTYITINGFDRDTLKEEYDNLYKAIETYKVKIEESKNQYELYKSRESSFENDKKMESAYSKMINHKEQLKKVYELQKRYISYMQTKGEGELKVHKLVYPNVFIKIKNQSLEVHDKSSMGMSYYYSDGKLCKD